MSEIKAKDVANEVYDALLALVGAYVASGISKGVFHKSLGAPDNIEGMVKLAIALGIGAALVDMAQTKGLLPVGPFKGTDTADKFEAKEVFDEIYEAIFALIGAYLVSRASQGIFHKSLGAPNSLETGVKLAFALGLGATAVTYLQHKEWLPKTIFKKASE